MLAGAETLTEIVPAVYHIDSGERGPLAGNQRLQRFHRGPRQPVPGVVDIRRVDDHQHHLEIVLMFVAAPLVAAPIVWAFLLIGDGAAGPPTAPPADQTTGQPMSRSPSCDLPAGPCSQGFVLGLRPLEC